MRHFYTERNAFKNIFYIYLDQGHLRNSTTAGMYTINKAIYHKLKVKLTITKLVYKIIIILNTYQRIFS